MNRSIFLKIYSGYFFTTIILAFLILFSAFRSVRSFYIEHLRQDLESLGLAIESEVIFFLENEDIEGLDGFCKRLGKKINIRITFIAPDGVVLTDSHNEPEVMENHKNRPEIIETLSGRVATSIRFSTTMDENLLYVAMPIREEDALLGVLRLSVSYKDINNLLRTLELNVLQVAGIIILILLFVSWWFSRSLALPIKSIINAYKSVSEGNLDIRIFPPKQGELQYLATGFNHMVSKLKESISEISRQKKELASVFSSIKEGLFLINKNGNIIFFNESFNKLFESDKTYGRRYWEVIREPKLLDIIKNRYQLDSGYEDEIVIGGRIFMLNLYILEDTKETLLSLYEITEMRRTEQMKKDFVVNVSHELRTPLTAIKGFIETMEETVDEENEHYLKIISRHTERLINIVKDLLLLSKLEEKEIELEKEKISLKGFIENNLKIFSKKISKKDITLELFILDDLPKILMDSFKMEQVFINLIDNAIKYTDEGKITISAEVIDNEIKITIEDTGIGIPENAIPRIFERFYTADRSRSRKMGGTGLGLSIVKHIILLHNGRIDIESQVGIGTKFIIFLPIS